MNLMPRVSQITIYPVKSLDGVALQKAEIAEGGCFMHDREYAIADLNGRFINGKANALVYLLRSSVDFESGIISFRHHDETTWKQFHLRYEKFEIDAYLTHFFGKTGSTCSKQSGALFDIPDISGITSLLDCPKFILQLEWSF